MSPGNPCRGAVFAHPLLATFLLTAGRGAEARSPDRPPTWRLFPRFTTSGEAKITDFRKLVNRVSIPAGWQQGAIASKMVRQTYCLARLPRSIVKRQLARTIALLGVRTPFWHHRWHHRLE